MKWLKPALAIWSLLALALLLFVLLPKAPAKESVVELYAEFLPGQSVAAIMSTDSCRQEKYREDYAPMSVGVIFVCTLPEDSPYARNVYVSSEGSTIQSAYFYLKPNTVLLGDLIAWFNRWERQRGQRRVYLLIWEGLTAYVGRGWPGLDTEIISISFRS